MDRGIVYPGAIPLETDLLNAQRNSMVGLSKLAAAILGTTTLANGLSCVPTGPASLQVLVNPGEIYSLQNVDGTAYSSLAADTTHQIVKQGIVMDQTTLNCPAPGTSGQSINYLVQATYQDADTGSTVLPYYNSSNPATAYSGPANSGTAQNTVRKGQCIVTVKAGAAATTGSQVTPSPDSGNVGLWVVTVANGQTQITSTSITAYPGAPLLPAAGALKWAIQTVTATSTLGAFITNTLVRINSGSSTTQTLPAASAVPAGTVAEFFNVGSGIGTVQRAGTDTIQVSSSTANSVALGAGDSLRLMSDGVSSWYAIGGSAQIGLAAVFAKVTTANGYQKLPGGLIMQWGTTSITSGSDTAQALPIAFPNVGLSVVASYSHNPGAVAEGYVVAVFNGLTGLVLRGSNASATNAYWLAFGI